MVGLVGVEPTTPAMSMQYSTVELKALLLNLNNKFYSNIFLNILNLLFEA